MFLVILSSIKKIFVGTFSPESDIGLHYKIERHVHDRVYYEINKPMIVEAILSI